MSLSERQFRCIQLDTMNIPTGGAAFRSRSFLYWAHQCEFCYVSFLILILARYWMEQNTMGNVVYGTNSTTVHDSIALIFTPIKSGYWCFDRWSHKRKKENKNTSKALVVTLNNTCYPHCYVLVGFRNKFKRYFTTELK